MSAISVYIHFDKQKKDELLLELEGYKGYVLEISDVLNIIVYYTDYISAIRIKALNSVSNVTDRKGKRIERF